VLPAASWPTITCVNLFTHTLLTSATDIRVRDGYQAVPNGFGLGVASHGPWSHSCTALYISLVILYGNIQGRDDDCAARG
jgi:hypothetical protein